MKNGYIYIANNIFPSLFAISEQEQLKGLMFEPFPPPIMSFIYSKPKINKFWMYNTESPLDILFCNNGEIQQIHYGEPFSTKIIGENKFSDLVVELPYSTISKLGIKIGNKIGSISFGNISENISG